MFEARMIEVDGLTKRFGQTVALDQVGFSVGQGSVLGLLGPNGAGKTTVVRILTTLLRPDAGCAVVSGFDVMRQANRVRRLIGLAGQFAAVDEMLTGRENLELIGLWSHLPRPEYREVADYILERMGLREAGDRLVRTYSGGMRRRLDIGASLVARPPVLFLDEPTTGLDPRTRSDLWQFVEELVAEGTTVLLTTQYMEEADRLADHIVLLDGGEVVADGTSEQLKQRVGGDVLEVRAEREDELHALAAVIGTTLGEPARVDADRQTVTCPAKCGLSQLTAVGNAIESEGLQVADLSIRRPSLDDVFLSLTGTGRRPVSAEAGVAAGALP